MVQNGIVYTSTAVLPAPPATNAHWMSAVNAPVCSRPSTTTWRRATIFIGRRVRISTRNSVIAPSRVRIAEKSKGSTYWMTCFITTQL